MRPALARSLRIAVLALVALATMELCARLEDRVKWGAPMLANYEMDQLFRFDQAVRRGVPHARYARWSLNSLGLRGPEPREPAGAPRVVVYGASEVFGMYESDGREFPRQLEQVLAAVPGLEAVEVFNAGIPGMRIGSGTGYLAELATRLAPAVVVLYPTPTHYIGTTRPNCGRPPRVPQAEAAAPQSRLAAKASERIKAALPPAALGQLRRLSIARATRHEPVLAALPPESLAALDADLACAVRAVRAIGATPVLVTHASRFGAEPRDDDAFWLTGWRMQYPELVESGFVPLERQANAVIRAAALRDGVPLVDAERLVGGEAARFADHAHFSDAGAARMAQVLAQALSELLPRGAPRPRIRAE